MVYELSLPWTYCIFPWIYVSFGIFSSNERASFPPSFCCLENSSLDFSWHWFLIMYPNFKCFPFHDKLETLSSYSISFNQCSRLDLVQRNLLYTSLVTFPTNNIFISVLYFEVTFCCLIAASTYDCCFITWLSRGSLPLLDLQHTIPRLFWIFMEHSFDVVLLLLVQELGGIWHESTSLHLFPLFCQLSLRFFPGNSISWASASHGSAGIYFLKNTGVSFISCFTLWLMVLLLTLKNTPWCIIIPLNVQSVFWCLLKLKFLKY